MGRAHPVRLTTAGSEFCVGASNRQWMRDHSPLETELRSVNSEFECPVIEPRKMYDCRSFQFWNAEEQYRPLFMVWNGDPTGVGATGANGQLRSHGHLRGPSSPHAPPDQTG